MKLIQILLLACLASGSSVAEPNKETKTKPVRQIPIYVTPYYEAAQNSEGNPRVSVNKKLDALLSSNSKQDIIAARDAIKLYPEFITPMTIMVLGIRLYDVGLRDEAVFWFYVAKNRYITMSDVLNMRSSGLGGVDTPVRNFALLAGPYINGYAFCNFNKQKEASLAAIEWVEKNPYEIIFLERLTSKPGSREQNLANSIESLKDGRNKELEYLSDAKNRKQFAEQRVLNQASEKFCWDS